MDHENIQKHTKSLVPTKYYDMFMYRLMGLTYEQIAEKTGYSHSWVRALFAKGGVLYEFWQQWLETAKENSLEEATTMAFGHLPDIMRTRIMQAKSLGAGAVESTKIILGLTFGLNSRKTVDPIPLEPSDERKQMILQAFSNFKVLHDETNNNPNRERNNSEPTAAP